MKALKIIGIILLLLALVIGILAALAPKEFKVERSVVVNAPAEIVFNNINSWAAFQQWNPWSDLDPNMKIETEGNDGEVGSVYRWAGTDDVGKGEMRKTLVEQNKRIEYDLIFTEPWEDRNNGFMQMEPDGDGFKVTWGFWGNNNFPKNIMGMLLNMDAMIGKDFEKGLEKFKAKAESEAVMAEPAPVEEIPVSDNQ
jgi:uncharacterized protein YndB with AHSA1/START domain